MEMFEQELELEKKSSWGPLLLVLALVGVIVGLIGYYAFPMKKGISETEATAVIENQLKASVPRVHFHSGKVVASMDDQPKDPHYRVLVV
jgi:xanthosine utilization system XapX-like protein